MYLCFIKFSGTCGTTYVPESVSNSLSFCIKGFMQFSQSWDILYSEGQNLHGELHKYGHLFLSFSLDINPD